jgi:glycerol-3-phosphate cytidylyltransferase-like family protein
MKVMVFGTFDDLHPGHRYLLDKALGYGLSATGSQPTAQSNELYVVVARDANVIKFKHRAPLQTENERVRSIQELYPKASVVLGNSDGD